MFDQIGSGQWLRYLVGALEVAGGIGVLVPRFSALATTGLALLMTGAVVTNLTVLVALPWSPPVLLVVAALVARAGWRRLLSPAPARTRALPSDT